jgi:hypothetical protein
MHHISLLSIYLDQLTRLLAMDIYESAVMHANPRRSLLSGQLLSTEIQSFQHANEQASKLMLTQKVRNL